MAGVEEPKSGVGGVDASALVTTVKPRRAEAGRPLGLEGRRSEGLEMVEMFMVKLAIVY